MNTNILAILKSLYIELPKKWQKLIYLFVYFIISIVSWRLTNLAAAYASQWVGPSLFGDFSVSLRVSHNLAHIFVMGQEATLLMYLAKYNDAPEKQSGLVRWISRSLILKSIILLSVIAFALMLDMQSISIIPKYFWLGFAAIPFVTICGVYERFFLFLKRFFIAFLPRGIYQPILFMLLIYILTRSVAPSPEAAIIAYGASFAITMIITIIFGLFSGFKITKESDNSDKKEWQVAGLFYTFSTLIIKSSPSFAFFFLEKLGPLETSVGLFAAMTNLTYGFHLLTKPFDSYLKPSIATLYTQNNIPELQEAVNFVNKMRWSIIALLFLNLLFFGKSYLLEYGETFLEAFHPLITLTALMVIQYLGMPCHELLNYTGNQRQLSYIVAVQCALIIILATALIPSYGIWGAVLAQGIPCMLATFASAFVLRKNTGIKAYFVF